MIWAGANPDSAQVAMMCSAMLNSWEHGKRGNCTLGEFIADECCNPEFCGGLMSNHQSEFRNGTFNMDASWCNAEGNGNNFDSIGNDAYAALNTILETGQRTTSGSCWVGDGEKNNYHGTPDLFGSGNTGTPLNLGDNRYAYYNKATGEYDYVVEMRPVWDSKKGRYVQVGYCVEYGTPVT